MTDETFLKVLRVVRAFGYGTGLLLMVTGIGWLACGLLEQGVGDVLLGALLAGGASMTGPQQ